MSHIPEQDLIAYHLNEAPDAQPIAHHLEHCAACAELSDSIAETLRVFSAEPVPRPNLDHAWQRLRGSLPAPPAQPARRSWGPRLAWLAPLPAVAVALFFLLPHHPRPQPPVYANHHPGPLTTEPTDAQVANHIDSAERLLTEVNHTSGPLDSSTLAQAHQLLLTNAVYVQQAHSAGDLAQAKLLENLGRVLTTLDHQQPGTGNDRGWHVRLEMNTDGLLLDLRILQQNDQQNEPQKESK